MPSLDPVKVDPGHYKVEFENKHVRVLRIRYGAHEKSVMHTHPAGVGVFLTNGAVKFGLPDGTTQDAQAKAGEVMWYAAQKHLPENSGDQTLEVILVELKGQGAKPKPAAKKAKRRR
jgi:quercetin dioxygenase-like cupin family protein